jgi:hypothetical protein
VQDVENFLDLHRKKMKELEELYLNKKVEKENTIKQPIYLSSEEP